MLHTGLLPLMLVSWALSLVLPTQAQTKQHVDAIQLRADAYPLGFSIEVAEHDRKTIYLGTGASLALGTLGNSQTEEPVAIGLAPYIDLQYRWYYHLSPRSKSKYLIRGNTGRYLAVRALLHGPHVFSLVGEAPAQASLGGIWGWQYQSSTGLYVAAQLGMGIGLDTENRYGLVPLLGAHLGWILWDIP